MKWTLTMLVALGVSACGDDDNKEARPTGFAWMQGDTADCEFEVLTFLTNDGVEHEVEINGLAVEAMNGAVKVDADNWEVVQRRGVRFATIFGHGSPDVDDMTPVNCIARDGWDPLRTKFANDTSRLPHFDFVRDHGYVYVGNPGDKDPLYPEMEGRSLIVDFDLAGDADVPTALGDSLGDLGSFRWKMVEKIDEETKGVFELDPVIP